MPRVKISNAFSMLITFFVKRREIGELEKIGYSREAASQKIERQYIDAELAMIRSQRRKVTREVQYIDTEFGFTQERMSPNRGTSLKCCRPWRRGACILPSSSWKT